jgi:hypothetical protein
MEAEIILRDRFENQNGVLIKSKLFIFYHGIEHHVTVFFCKRNTKLVKCPSGSMTALCKMEQGDHAWIRTTGVSTGHQLYSADNYPQSAFLGLLIDSMF